MARLSWTPEAADSLRDIHRSMARTRPETASRTLESILNKVDALSEYPGVGQPYHHCPQHDVRVVSYGHFRIAYLVEGPEVVVLGVFNGRIFLPPLTAL